MSFAVNSNKTYKTKITYSVVLTEVCDNGDWYRLVLCVPISYSLHAISFRVPKVQQRVSKGIRLACMPKVRQNSKKKTTNHHCILEQCKQIIFSIKHCFNFCLKTDCEHSTSIFDSITSIHIFTPVYRMLRLPKFVLYSGIQKKVRCQSTRFSVLTDRLPPWWFIKRTSILLQMIRLTRDRQGRQGQRQYRFH